MKVSMSTVWDRTSEFLSDNFAAVTGLAAVTILVPGVITETVKPLKGSVSGLALGLSLLSLVTMLVSLWGQLAIIAMAIDPAAGTAAARARATRRFWPTILVGLAIVVIAFVLVSPVVFTLAANGVDLARLGQPGAQANLSPGAGGFIVLYLLILVPVALWLLARFGALSGPIVVAERQALGAFGRSYRLTHGLTWRIIGVVLLYIVVLLVASLAAVTVVGALVAIVFDMRGPISIGSFLVAAVEALVSTIFAVIGAVFTAKLYLAVRDREDAAQVTPTP